MQSWLPDKKRDQNPCFHLRTSGCALRRTDVTFDQFGFGTFAFPASSLRLKAFTASCFASSSAKRTMTAKTVAKVVKIATSSILCNILSISYSIPIHFPYPSMSFHLFPCLSYQVGCLLHFLCFLWFTVCFCFLRFFHLRHPWVTRGKHVDDTYRLTLCTYVNLSNVCTDACMVYIYCRIPLRANTPIRPHPFYAVHLGISNVRLYIQLGQSTRVFREYKFPTPVKLLHSLKIFNKGLFLPPPLNFYIHWRSSIRVYFSHPR